jgi:TonB family protein
MPWRETGDFPPRTKPGVKHGNRYAENYCRNLKALTLVPRMTISMGYRALLFCPDDKTAQTVTLVLNDLEFTVEACSEPFVAVKKLMGEHFDGVVVDCDNEQNATLLFKSARQSATNQSSLSVAIVEGQAGVAKAFRIGANLVLTKPINVEQAKGTLRVARGLLRKGEPAKPLAQAEAKLPPSAAAPPRSTAIKPSMTGATPPLATPRSTSAPSAIPAALGNQPADSVAQAAHASTRDQTASRAATPGSSPSAATRQSVLKASAPPISGSSMFGTGAASAIAPARVPHEANTEEPLLSKIARTVGTMDERAETSENEPLADPVSAPVSRAQNEHSGGDHLQATAETGSLAEPKNTASRKILLAVAAMILLVLVLYLGWARMHGQLHLGSASENSSSPGIATKSQPLTPSAVPPAAAEQTALSVPASMPGGEQNSQPVNYAEHAGATPGPAEAASATSGPVSETPAVKATRAVKASDKPLVVGSGKKELAQKHSATEPAAPTVVVSAENSEASLPNLVNVSTNSTTPVLQSLVVSQGVSQGLLIKKVQPTYPPAALRLHLEGAVQLMTTVSAAGKITAVKAMSGEPLLAKAAVDAVRQWKYKPYLLNGEPVEVQTQITINFKLPY